MVAYIYSNYLDAYSEAMEKYELFMEKYPNDELIPSVEFELEGLKKYQPTINSLNNYLFVFRFLLGVLEGLIGHKIFSQV